MALFSLDINGQLSAHLSQEWLLSNGLGGFSSSTVVGCNTRRYHGLLIAATQPPVGRVLSLTRIGESLVLDGEDDARHEFGVNQFAQGFHPCGWHYLRKFELDDTARWEYEIEGVQIAKELLLLWRQNIVGIRYTLAPTRSRRIKLGLSPFLSLRDFHGLRHVNDTQFSMESKPREVRISAYPFTTIIKSDAGAFEAKPDWWYNHLYAIDADRGSDATEDLYTPGTFTLETDGRPASFTLWASLDGQGPLNWDEQLQARRKAIGAAHTKPIAAPSPTIRGLIRAANDFVVYRKMPSGEEGATIIAGYPWFADWGRDTMISLPGLLLVTGRFDQARQVLSVFAQYCSQGMIPNRFDDYTNQPSYNTVDASLWFVHAVFEYLRHTGDRETFKKILRPACQSILDGYRNGTRYHIKMDPADGLISQGDAATQLTWMDAKCRGVAFTPRQGKPVEINALWHHALMLMGDTALAAKVGESFRKAFWISSDRGLADVVDGPPGPQGYAQRDLSLRPNQIFAVSLPNSALDPDQQRAVVEVVRRELLTPMGLRTLARGDSRYCGRYTGDQFHRDSCYHNGTVWAWLIGGFLTAYLRVNGNSPAARDRARGWLGPLIDQMQWNCIGQIAEIYEAEEPHRMVGCCAQAWSVAEALRLAVDLGM